jgi:serine/threonine protein kinase
MKGNEDLVPCERDRAVQAETNKLTADGNPRKNLGQGMMKENDRPARPDHLDAKFKKCSSLPLFHPNSDASAMLTLFRNQALAASGVAYFKPAILQRPKKYFVELRGSTMVMFKNPQVARAPKIIMRDVFAVLVLKIYNVTISKRQGQSARLNVHGPGLDQGQVLFIKAGSVQLLETWRQALAVAESLKLPDLMSMTIESVIGQGGGGKVFLVHHKGDNQNYALKVIDKRHAFASASAMRHIVSERNLMEIVGKHPFVLQMQFAFQTDYNLFIGTPFCGGGDLATYLKKQFKKKGSKSPELAYVQRRTAGEPSKHVTSRNRYGGHLSEEKARTIAAEVLLALEHLHERGIVYRDLKPENIFIDDHGHLKLGDFGLSKHLQPSRSGTGFSRTASICGTRNYLPPEMLLGNLYAFEVDMWSYGVMLFRIMCGRFPFDASRTKEVFQMVKKDIIRVPEYLSAEAKSLIEGLLDKDQARRLSVSEVKCHRFFEGIDWGAVRSGLTAPPITDLDLGQALADVLDNFELSQLQGVTVGEYIPSGVDGSEIDNGPQGRMNPDGRIIGFEFAAVDCDAPCPPPLEVKRMGSIVESFKKIRSLDSDVGEKMKSAMHAVSPKATFHALRSPRGVKVKQSRFPDRCDESDEETSAS